MPRRLTPRDGWRGVLPPREGQHSLCERHTAFGHSVVDQPLDIVVFPRARARQLEAALFCDSPDTLHVILH